MNISFKTIALLSIGKAKFRTGTSFHQVDFKPKGKPLIKIGNMKGQGIDFTQVDYVTPKGKNFAEENEILIAMRGGTTGKLAIVDRKSAGSHFVGSIGNFGPIDDQLIWPPYLKYIQAQLYTHFVEGTKGSATPMVSIEMLRKINIRIPDSIEGQKEMYAFLENAHSKVGNLRDLVTSQSTYLAQLRQAILQEAIEGKLTAEWRAKQSEGTERNENNDAAVLLEKIKAEKAALVAKGKIKKEKPLPPIEPGEVPFALPEGWAWTRLGELTESITYGTSEKCSYDSSKNAKVLRIPNVSSGIIDGTDLKFTRLSKKEMQELSLKYGDILTIRSNGSPEIVGTMAFVTEAFENYCFAGYLIRLRFHSPLIGHFLSKVSRAKSIRAQIEDPLRTTVGINNINTQELSSLKFPLPPLAEQHAIVERVDRLLAMVDQLEQQVAERKVQAEELMQAVLREAFS